jgi:hypothetical protein
LLFKEKKMRKLRVVIWIVAVLVAVALVITLVANSSYVKQRLIHLATEALSKELHTEVAVDDIGLNLLMQQASIYGIELKDQQQHDLLKVGKIGGRVRLLALLRGRLELSKCNARDVGLLLLKPDDGVPNYQFLIDVMQQKKKDKEPTVEGGKNGAFKMSLRDAVMEHLHVNYNGEDFSMDKAVYNHSGSKHILTLHHLKGGKLKRTAKHTILWHFDIGQLTATYALDGEKHIEMAGVKIKSDNHEPRRNTGRPKRGAFDWGHMDFVTDASVDVLYAEKDSLSLRVGKCHAVDTVAGFDLNVSGNVALAGRNMLLTDVVVKQIDTRIDIAKAQFLLPAKGDSTSLSGSREKESLSYHADSVRARAILKDISRPFAPALKNFSIPLNVLVSISGTDQGMSFRGIRIDTDDRKLTINAAGVLRNLQNARQLALHFSVHDMVAKPGIKDKIINQFTVKKYMMNQIYALGVIGYRGNFDILWKKEQFRGLLTTELGNVDFEFEIDDQKKFVTGTVDTDSLRLESLFQMNWLGNIACSATFSVDISKKRTAAMRKEKGGKLPIGSVNANVRKVGYRMISMKDIEAEIHSDGALAKGEVTMNRSLTGLALEFSFTNTTEMHKMKVKPRLRFSKKKEVVKDEQHKGAAI